MVRVQAQAKGFGFAKPKVALKDLYGCVSLRRGGGRWSTAVRARGAAVAAAAAAAAAAAFMLASRARLCCMPAASSCT